MNSLNLTRSCYLNRLLDRLCEMTPALVKENQTRICGFILQEIKHVYVMQAGGCWPITASDQIFLDYLEQISFLIEYDSPPNEFLKIRQEVANRSTDKLKVLFLASDVSVWPSIETVYQAIADDPRFIIDMIDLPIRFDLQYTDTDFYSGHKNSGHSIKHYQEYNLSEESPDVAIYSKPYGGGEIVPPQFYIIDLKKVVPRSVLVPYAFFDLADNDFYIYNGYHFPLHYFAWKWIGYSKKFRDQAQRLSFGEGKNVSTTGHPKFDQIAKLDSYESDTKEAYRTIIAGRKAVLYNSHHKIGQGPTDSGAFPEYYERLFRYFEQHKDMVLIWRPHPFFFVTALTVFSQEQLDAVVARVKAIDNIILDQSDNYLAAFALSDALLTDGATSMAFEYVATDKPVYYTAKPNGGFVMPEGSVADLWYWISTPKALEESLEQIRDGKDPMKAQRILDRENYIGSSDGQSGIRIRDEIYQDLVLEETKKVDGFFDAILQDVGDSIIKPLTPLVLDFQYHLACEFPPLISAVIVNFNNVALITQTIDSVLQQNYPNIELIISDDCSSEGFDAQAVQAYVECNKRDNIKRCCINVNEHNLGTVAHLERVRQLCKGEYELNIASDDIYCDADAFAKLMDCALSNDAEWVVSQVEMCDYNLKESEGMFLDDRTVAMLKSRDYKGIQEENVHRCILPAAGTLYRKSFFNKIGTMSDRYVLIEDYSSSVRALRMKIPVYYVDAITVKHRHGGISHGNSARRSAKYAQYVEDFLVIFETEVEAYKRDIRRSAYRLALKSYCRNLKSYEFFKQFLPKYIRRNDHCEIRNAMRKKLLRKGC